jgi:hypothetical protein
MAQEARDLGLCGAEGLYRLDKFLRSLSRVLMSHGFLLHPVSVEPVPLKLFVCPAPDKRQLLVTADLIKLLNFVIIEIMLIRFL